MGRYLWIRQDNSIKATFGELPSLLETYHIPHAPAAAASVIAPVQPEDFSGLVSLLQQKGLLHEGSVGIGYVVLHRSDEKCHKSFLTREETALVILESAGIPIKMSLPYWLVEVKASIKDEILEKAISDSGWRAELPEVYPIRKREFNDDLEPLHYMSKEEVARLIERRKYQGVSLLGKNDDRGDIAGKSSLSLGWSGGSLSSKKPV